MADQQEIICIDDDEDVKPPSSSQVVLPLTPPSSSSPTTRQSFQCDLCPFNTPFKSGLSRHVSVSHAGQDKRLRCDQCPFSTFQNAQLLSHKISRHQRRFVKTENNSSSSTTSQSCPHCQFSTNSISRFAAHISTVHADNINVRLRCELCEFSCRLQRTMTKHIQDVHSSSLADKMFRCPHCEFVATRKWNLANHVNGVHLKTKWYDCDLCDFTHLYKSQLYQHRRKKHGLGRKEEVFRCEYCEFAAKSKRYLWTHTNALHTKETWYTCDKCDFRNLYETELYRHKKKNHGNGREAEKEVRLFRCDYCQFAAKSRSYLKIHTNGVHTKETWYSCDKCDYKHLYECELYKHKRKKHGTTTITKQQQLFTKPFRCPHCEFSARDRWNLKQHVKAMHLRKTKHCDGRREKRGNEEQRNIDATTTTAAGSSSSSANKPFSCDQCQYTTRDRQALARHKRGKHTDERDHCPHCEFTTAYESNLRAHIAKVHLITKSRLCDRCDYSTSRVKDLRLHKLQCHQEESSSLNTRIYKCGLCQFNCNDLKLLDKHRRQHKDVAEEVVAPNLLPQQTSLQKKKMQQCLQCESSYPSKYDLRMHVLTSHSKGKQSSSSNNIGNRIDHEERSTSDLSRVNRHHHPGERRHDLKTQTMPQENKSYKCDRCEYDAGNNPGALRIHKFKNHRRATTEEEGVTEIGKDKNHRHQERTEEEEEEIDEQLPKIRCLHCDETYDELTRDDHMLTFHHAVSDFRCGKCNFTSENSFDLSGHKSSGCDGKVISMMRCPDCSYLTSCKDAFSWHRRTKHGGARYLFKRCHCDVHKGGGGQSTGANNVDISRSSKGVTTNIVYGDNSRAKYSTTKTNNSINKMNSGQVSKATVTSSSNNSKTSSTITSGDTSSNNDTANNNNNQVVNPDVRSSSATLERLKKCLDCDVLFASNSKEEHLRRFHHVLSKSSCAKCDFVFRGFCSEILHHSSSNCDGTMVGLLQCPDCEFVCECKEAYSSHRKTVHRATYLYRICLCKEHKDNNKESTNNDNNKESTNDDKKKSSNISDVTMFQCPTCSYWTLCKVELARHRRSAHGWKRSSDDEITFPCPCNLHAKLFSSSSAEIHVQKVFRKQRMSGEIATVAQIDKETKRSKRKEVDVITLDEDEDDHNNLDCMLEPMVVLTEEDGGTNVAGHSLFRNEFLDPSRNETTTTTTTSREIADGRRSSIFRQEDVVMEGQSVRESDDAQKIDDDKSSFLDAVEEDVSFVVVDKSLGNNTVTFYREDNGGGSSNNDDDVRFFRQLSSSSSSFKCGNCEFTAEKLDDLKSHDLECKMAGDLKCQENQSNGKLISSSEKQIGFPLRHPKSVQQNSNLATSVKNVLSSALSSKSASTKSTDIANSTSKVLITVQSEKCKEEEFSCMWCCSPDSEKLSREEMEVHLGENHCLTLNEYEEMNCISFR